MTIAAKLQSFLTDNHIQYELCSHPYSHTSAETARLAHVPMDRLAKSVVLEDDDGYVVAVLPANRRVHLGEIRRLLHRRLHLASEADLSRLFDDCTPGAVPPVGRAYGLPTIMEESLAEAPEVYFEAGDHTALVHLSPEQFLSLMQGAVRTHFIRAH
jgi:Ala-tRNA(Pro) deacylase